MRCEQRNETTLVSASAMEVAKCLRSWQVQFPSPELGQLLVSHLCSSSSSSSSSLWSLEIHRTSSLLSPCSLEHVCMLLLYCLPSFELPLILLELNHVFSPLPTPPPPKKQIFNSFTEIVCLAMQYSGSAYFIPQYSYYLLIFDLIFRVE